ncbi:hypothetical protein HPB50_000870 [Hyalomma asiaticum]|uniref:Uncharacterized protein n=1 Tax=Hyalomma asiaticum TaxID=266040 RepID=A0ACB7S6X7_HYAAI|nr:hypothetical protein HPB50_000870 [Hyalomma asiaticum]
MNTVQIASSAKGRATRGSSGGRSYSGFLSSGRDTITGDPVGGSALCAGLALVLLVGTVVYALVTRMDPPMKTRYCKGLTCADPYKALEGILNHTVKPCDDMYAHVCSRWTRNREHVGFLQESLDNYLTKMRDILETADVNAVGEGLADGLRTCGHLLSQCLAAMKTNVFSLKEGVRYLTDRLFLTRVISSKTSREALQEGTEISFTFDLNGFLKLRPQRMDNVAVVYGFQGSAVQTALPATADLKGYVEAVVQANSIVKYSQSLITGVVSIDGFVAARERHAKSASKTFSAKGLRDESLLLDALVAKPMDRLVRLSSLSKGYVIVRDYDNILFSIRTFDRAPREDVALYLVVQMLVDLFVFDHMTRSKPYDEWRAFRVCSDAVSRAMPHVWSSLSRQLMLNKTSLDPVSELFGDVKAVILSDQGFVRSLLDNATFYHVHRKLENVSCVSNRELLEQQRNLVLTSGSWLPSDNFVSNHMAVRHHTRSLSLKWPPSATWDIASISEMETRPSYNEATSSLFVSTVLEIPHVFYADDSARILSYGTLGAAMARELIKSFVHLQETEPRYTVDATKELLGRMTCYAKHDAGHVKESVSNLKTEIFPWIASVKVAYDAMRKTFQGGGIISNNSVWKSVQRQFFLRFCLAACESSDETAVKGRHRCVWPLAESPAFSEAFDCPKNSRMSFRQCHL